MQLSDAHVALLNSILKEWNQAEADIKLAEQVNHKVVNPSIKELRYAGRRVVDMIARMAAGGSDEELEALLRDARFDCHRARHDAIDAGTSKIAIDIDIMTKKLGYDVILAVHQPFPALVQSLKHIRDDIVASRGDRENREKLYAVLERIDFPALVTKYNELMANEDLMKRMAKRKRWELMIGIGGLVIGIAALIIELAHWGWAYFSD